MTDQITIIPPAIDEDALSGALRNITRAIVERDESKHVGGFLGGTYGYGADWASPIFDMRPFYWGECDCGWEQLEDEWCSTHAHADDCYQMDLRERLIAAGGKPTMNGLHVDRPESVPYDQWEAARKTIYDDLCREYGKPRFGCAVHCSCSYQDEWQAFARANGHKPTCSLELPNFRHHATGFEVRWYKYIGRGVEVKNAPDDLAQILADCLADITSATEPRA